MVGIVEDEAGAHVQRHGARAGGRVGRIARMQGEGIETWAWQRTARVCNQGQSSSVTDSRMAHNRASLVAYAHKPMTARSALYPPIEPHRSGQLQVSDRHSLYWEECGNPQGVPVVFLHGGPGGGCSARHRQFFDPSFYRIVLFDQRAAPVVRRRLAKRAKTPPPIWSPTSKPCAPCSASSAGWVFGGSWGSTLALAYGEAHPQRCLGFVLRGIFLARAVEIDWFIHGMRHVFPEAWRQFARMIPEAERDDLLAAYGRRLFDPDPKIHLPHARAWGHYEGSCSNLLPAAAAESAAHMEADAVALGLARLECHYMLHGAFLAEGELLTNLTRIVHLPCAIVQGRYDMVCPIMSADDLQRRWSGCEYVVVPDGGHSAWEPGMTRELGGGGGGLRTHEDADWSDRLAFCRLQARRRSASLVLSKVGGFLGPARVDEHGLPPGATKETTMKVSDILRVKGNALFTISPDATLASAVHSMAAQDIGSLVVMEYGDLAGMLTFREVIQRLHSNDGAVGSITVRSVMDDHPLTCTPQYRRQRSAPHHATNAIRVICRSWTAVRWSA